MGTSLYATATPLTSDEQLLLDLINQTRVSAGVASVALNDPLRTAALAQANYMDSIDTLTHVGPNGSNFLQRAQAAGYTGNMGLAEFPGSGGMTPAFFLNALLSATYPPPAPFNPRDALLAASLKDIGIGLSSPDGYWDVLVGPVVLTPTSPGGGTTPSTPLTINAAACAVETEPVARTLCFINDVRTRTGGSAVALDAALSAASANHDQDMASKSFFSHTGSDGSGFWQRVLAAGYAGTAVGELIAAFDTADAAVQAWLDSAPHRDLLLNTSSNEVGIDFLQVPNSQNYYWTVEFGYEAPSGAIPAPNTVALLAPGLVGMGFSRRKKT